MSIQCLQSKDILTSLIPTKFKFKEEVVSPHMGRHTVEGVELSLPGSWV